MPLPHTGNHRFVLCICASAYFMLYSVVIIFFKIPHISNIIEYLSSPVWLISLGIIPSMSISVAVNGNTSFFFMAVYYSIVCAHVCMYVCVCHIFMSQCILTVLAKFSVVLYMALKATLFWTNFLVPLIMRFMGIRSLRSAYEILISKSECM